MGAVPTVRIAVALGAVLLAGCGSPTPDQPLAEPTVTLRTEAAAPTEQEPVVQTPAPTETPAAAEEDPVEALWAYEPPAVTPPEAAADIVGGAPDRVQAAALRRHLADSGHDLTKLGIHVLPIAGAEGSLLVLSFVDSTALGSSPDEAGERFAADLVDGMAELRMDVVQVALNYASTADGEPFVLTTTFKAADAKKVLSGAGDATDLVQVQLERGRR